MSNNYIGGTAYVLPEEVIKNISKDNFEKFESFVVEHKCDLLDFAKALNEDITIEEADIEQENNFGIKEMEVDKDHIHLLVEYTPSQSALEIVRLLKQISTYRIWRKAGNSKYLQKYFWKENTFWNDGYFACRYGSI